MSNIERSVCFFRWYFRTDFKRVTVHNRALAEDADENPIVFNSVHISNISNKLGKLD